MKPLTQADVALVGEGMLPPSALSLIGIVGLEPGLALLNAWPGIQFVCPKHRARNPKGQALWSRLAAIVGEDAMTALAAECGGTVIEVPVCEVFRREIRNRSIRQLFDELTMKCGASKAQAVQELGMAFAPITYRQLEKIIDGVAVESEGMRQGGLF